ncbi:lutropin subunit beta-like [Crotalus tigris]|uniref:lutropin subunit beta-like n=1 Tax=Crotalus tigris TaxID=88082 RepID=UPI00192F8B9F|nr:lutropin subunit beta-like [Crotalus tigris]
MKLMQCQSYEIFLISSLFYIQAKNPLLATFLFLAAIHENGLASSNQGCRLVNATIAAEKDDCPVCMAITTSICSGYCKTKEMLWKPLFSSFNQKVCIYKEVQYETALLQGCPPDVDPSFTYPVALSCHCNLCNMDSSDCTVQGTGPDSCINQNRHA